MYNRISSALLGALLMVFCISCSDSYPELQSVQWKKDMNRASLQYFSPSMVDAGAALDESGRYSKLLSRVHDFAIFTIKPEMEDEYVYKPMCMKFFDDIDSLGLSPIIPTIKQDSSTIRVLGHNDNGNLNYVMVAIDQNPGVSVYEVRGDSLQKTVSQLMMQAMLSGGNLDIPFFRP